MGNFWYFLTSSPHNPEKEKLPKNALYMDVIEGFSRVALSKNCQVNIFIDSCYSGNYFDYHRDLDQDVKKKYPDFENFKSIRYGECLKEYDFIEDKYCFDNPSTSYRDKKISFFLSSRGNETSKILLEKIIIDKFFPDELELCPLDISDGLDSQNNQNLGYPEVKIKEKKTIKKKEIEFFSNNSGLEKKEQEISTNENEKSQKNYLDTGSVFTISLINVLKKLTCPPFKKKINFLGFKRFLESDYGDIILILEEKLRKELKSIPHCICFLSPSITNFQVFQNNLICPRIIPYIETNLAHESQLILNLGKFHGITKSKIMAISDGLEIGKCTIIEIADCFSKARLELNSPNSNPLYVQFLFDESEYLLNYKNKNIFVIYDESFKQVQKIDSYIITTLELFNQKREDQVKRKWLICVNDTDGLYSITPKTNKGGPVAMYDYQISTLLNNFYHSKKYMEIFDKLISEMDKKNLIPIKAIIYKRKFNHSKEKEKKKEELIDHSLKPKNNSLSIFWNEEMKLLRKLYQDHLKKIEQKNQDYIIIEKELKENETIMVEEDDYCVAFVCILIYYFFLQVFF